MIWYSFVRIALELSELVTTFVDRVMIYNLKASYDAGIYFIGYKIGSIADILMISVNTAMVPNIFEKHSAENSIYSEIEKVSSIVFIFFILLFLRCLLLSMIYLFF
ncbi:hypothetical protein DYQ05_00965 [Treponema pedis]|nr:hypothetical protein DYQ05_00965 [Treponema pedis]